MVRPREWDRAALAEEFLQYIESTDIPIVAEFAYTRGITRERLYEMEELSYALKVCVQKKEAALESKALKGDVNCTMAIFSLKQLGWKDTHHNEHTGKDGGPLVITITNTDAAL